MTYRKIDTQIWYDPWFQKLSLKGQHFFIYLWTNRHCNQAGLYEISLRTIEFDTGYKTTSKLLEELQPKVYHFKEDNIIWIKNFFKYQCQNGSFASGAIKAIQDYPVKYVATFIEYNRKYLDQFDTVQTPCIDGVNMVVPLEILFEHHVDTVKTPETPEQNRTDKKQIQSVFSESEKQAQEIYSFYNEEIKPINKSRQRCLTNLSFHLKGNSIENLKAAIKNYKPMALERDSAYRKDPANFFGRNEPYFKDFLPDNFQGEPEAEDLWANL
ncbi:MAG: hypothetical protein JRI26_11440 [Deltaproteobacteria bacterium]|nr:hypothetical protein [Deltaproteobacteria bacterium]